MKTTINILFFLFFGTILHSQSIYGYNMPNWSSRSPIAVDQVEDTLFITYQWYGYELQKRGFNWSYEATPRIEKEVYIIDQYLGVIRGKVVPEKVIPEHYEFENKITPPSIWRQVQDSISIMSDLFYSRDSLYTYPDTTRLKIFKNED